MKETERITRFVGISALAAIVAVLQYLSNFITFGPFTITLALVPVVIGAIIYGYAGGSILGFVMGIVVLAMNSQVFFAINPWATVLICLGKSTLAGLCAALVFKLFRNKHLLLAAICASLVAPIVNTGFFALGCLIFFRSSLIELGGGSTVMEALFINIIGLNFIIEFAVNSTLSPAIYRITLLFKDKIFTSLPEKDE